MTPTSIPVRLLRRLTAPFAALVCALLLGLCTAPQAQAALVDPTPPDAPTDLTVQPGDRILTVFFTPPVVNEVTILDGYEYSLDGGTIWTSLPLVATLGISKAGATMGEIEGVLNGQGYAVQVRALSNAGPGASTAPVITQTDAWFHDPLSKKQRLALVKVPAHPKTYTGKAARTVAFAASRNGSPAVAASTLAGRQLQEGQAVSIPAASFKPGTAKLTTAGKALVGDAIASLAYVGSVRCEGYSDYAGNAAAAATLATARATAVCDLLVADGAAVKTWVKGFGPTRPLAIGGTATFRADNGRVVLLMLA